MEYLSLDEKAKSFLVSQGLLEIEEQIVSLCLSLGIERDKVPRSYKAPHDSNHSGEANLERMVACKALLLSLANRYSQTASRG